MRYAIVSDIHANRQAWRAVLGDIRACHADAILCLGDIVGYGPMPLEVVESVLENCQVAVIGNHDAVVGGRCDPGIFNDAARRVIEWTQARLGSDKEALFADLPTYLEGDQFMAVHADIRDPEAFGYIETNDDARSNFNVMTLPVLFVGHTHQSGVFIQDRETGRIQWTEPVEFGLTPDSRYIVNVGSVGDPRNPRDIRASYCLYDDDTQTVQNRKIPFDIDAYQQDLLRATLKIKPFFMLYWTDQGHYPAPEQDDAMRSRKIIRQCPQSTGRIRLDRTQLTRSTIDFAAIMIQKRARLEQQQRAAEAEARRREAEAATRKLLLAEKAARKADERRKQAEIHAEQRRRRREAEREQVRAALEKRRELAR